ncbi:MAG TPA: hypothetical protein VLA17_13780 [Candidatus Limnocylindria bacterium]|nr:hypothetical protein [Candidatus Limnocylindria bacterium]
MNQTSLTSALVIFLLSLTGCASGPYNQYSDKIVVLYQQEAGNGYCHKKLEPIGPTDPARPNQIGGGDYIDYYGPCEGPTLAEMIQAQKRFESYRFNMDFNNEG